MPPETPTVEVLDDRERSRFEVAVDGEVAGFTEYRLRNDRITLLHTEIDGAYEGQGLGSRLVRDVLDRASDTGLAVLPSCPFVASWIQRHPEYVELVPEGARAAYDLA